LLALIVTPSPPIRLWPHPGVVKVGCAARGRDSEGLPGHPWSS